MKFKNFKRQNSIANIMKSMIVIFIFLFSIALFSNQSIGNSNNTTFKEYTFQDSINNTAWKGFYRYHQFNLSQNPSSLIKDSFSSFSIDDYINVSYSDDNRTITRTDAGNGSMTGCPYHLFRFNITENITDIANIGILWEGYAWGYTCWGEMAELYVWNTTNSSWEKIANYSKKVEWRDNISDENLSNTLIDITNYLDENNSIFIIALGPYGAGYSDSTLATDFIKIISSPFSELIPFNISLSKQPYENQEITISSLIKNIGKGNATNFTVSLIIDNNFIENKTISLNALSSSLISFNWTVSKGNHEIKISIDKDNKIIEKNETNNEIKTFISVLPDLTPNLFTSHERILIGDNLTIFALIKNIGNANAENFSVKFYIDNISVRNFTLSTLNFNENKTLSFNYTFEKGNHTIKVVVDEENIISELNEGNNEASLEIVVNERIVGANSFYMNLFIIIVIAFLVAIVRKRFSQ